ncbi:phage antirepressor KilAC domain-containing protein [Cupriavidus sp. UME77]|uniref:phage antirepressor KilAC domain-containing protein n=1 Tax=Cupriavidus sp. UME77 TaxID=1862321 RepID=UPI00351C3BA1
MSIRAAAQCLSVRQGELFAWLSARGWISTHPETNAWAACDAVIERGWLATRRKTIGYQRYVFQALVTPLGLAELSNHVLTADDGKRAKQRPQAQQCGGFGGVKEC